MIKKIRIWLFELLNENLLDISLIIYIENITKFLFSTYFKY